MSASHRILNSEITVRITISPSWQWESAFPLPYGNPKEYWLLEVTCILTVISLRQQQSWCCLTTSMYTHQHCSCSVSQLCPAYHASGNQTDPLRQIWCPSFATNRWGETSKHQKHGWKRRCSCREWFLHIKLIPIIKAWESLCLSISSCHSCSEIPEGQTGSHRECHKNSILDEPPVRA